jgi:hypothetical protein
MSLVTLGLGDTSGGGGTPISISSVVGASNLATVNCAGATPVLIGGALDKSNWVITNNSSGDHLMVGTVTVVGDTIELITSEQVNGATYIVNIPTTGIISLTDGTACIGPFTPTFTGVGTNPAILMIQSVDARHVNVLFNVPVNNLDALNTNNYVGDNGLTITASTKLSDSIFQLTTSRQVVGTAYTITASNIRDFSGNYV